MASKKNKFRKNKTMRNKNIHPSIKSLKRYKTDGTNLNTIKYSIYGNKLRKPVLFIDNRTKIQDILNVFNPNNYYIIVVQCKYIKNKENIKLTIEDFEKLRDKLNIKKWTVVGESFKINLPLSYTLSYPKRVNGLILDGILYTKGEIDRLIKKNNAVFGTISQHGGTQSIGKNEVKLKRFEFKIKTFSSPTTYLLLINDTETGFMHYWFFGEEEPTVMLRIMETEEDEEPILIVNVRYIPDTHELQIQEMDSCTSELCENFYLDSVYTLYEPPDYTLRNVNEVLDDVNARLRAICPNLSIHLRNLEQHTGVSSVYDPAKNYITICLYHLGDCVASIQFGLAEGWGSFISKTRTDLEGRGFNQLLRAVVIMLAPHIYFKGEPITFINSIALNWKSAYVLLSRYDCEIDDFFKAYIRKLQKKNIDVSITPDFIKSYYYENQEEPRQIEVGIPITPSNLAKAKMEMEKMRINCSEM